MKKTVFRISLVLLAGSLVVMAAAQFGFMFDLPEALQVPRSYGFPAKLIGVAEILLAIGLMINRTAQAAALHSLVLLSGMAVHYFMTPRFVEIFIKGASRVEQVSPTFIEFVPTVLLIALVFVVLVVGRKLAQAGSVAATVD
ncbi:MAG: hypothetical protein JKY49_09200 [Cohaesibacteraceae bacterium]|nr:hypothetical protein [Cohaesibacteraceae bacterium]